MNRKTWTTTVSSTDSIFCGDLLELYSPGSALNKSVSAVRFRAPVDLSEGDTVTVDRATGSPLLVARKGKVIWRY